MKKINHRATATPRPGLAAILLFCLLGVRAEVPGRSAPHQTPAGKAIGLFDLPALIDPAPTSGGRLFESFDDSISTEAALSSPSSFYLVNSTLDTPDAAPGNDLCADAAGRCTLRAAIEEANAHSGADAINFGIGTGPQTIVAASDLPAISEPLTLDATTQPGYAGTPLIEVAGVSSAFGFDVVTAGTVIKGFILNRWNTAIQLDVGGGHVIENCYIGTDAAGVSASANRFGIVVRSPNNRIGGTGALSSSAATFRSARRPTATRFKAISSGPMPPATGRFPTIAVEFTSMRRPIRPSEAPRRGRAI
jgi:CSLREA domain-containing protein